MTVSFIALFLFLAIGVLEGMRLVKLHPDIDVDSMLKVAPHFLPITAAAFVPILMIIIPGLNDYMVWNGPVWYDAHNVQIRFGLLSGIFGFLFGSATYVAFKTAHPTARNMLAASILVLSALGAIQWQYLKSVADMLSHVVNRDGIVLQTSGSSCAAAAGANIANRLGVETREKEMAQRMGTTDMGGTSAGQAILGMAQLGIKCVKFNSDISDISQASAPAMLFVDHPGLAPEGHAVSYMGMENGKVEIWNPVSGKKLYSIEGIKKIWHGKALVCKKMKG